MIRRHRASTQEPSRILLKALARKGHPNERFRAFLDLSKKPTDGSFVRVRKRCSLTGRSRGLVHRKTLMDALRMSINGRSSAFQADSTGSSPVVRTLQLFPWWNGRHVGFKPRSF
eukprot:scaffold5782_cov618-Prasinococcus_capsulatus_cf.AAC.22